MSTLSAHSDRYLKLRRQLGFKLKVEGILLRNFVCFAEVEGVAFITTKLALRWATQPQNIEAAQRGKRLSVVRRFARYLSAVDPRTEVPAQKLLPCRFHRRPPYLYRKDEILQLVNAARQIDPTNELKRATYGTLFGLLAVTGMRVGEAIALDRGDVDLKRDLLTIRRAKGNKSRLIPLHSSTGQALQQYAALRDRIHPQASSSSFLVSEKGARLCYPTVNRWFLLLACQLGLRKPGDRRGARLHDLRHDFAIRTLRNWYRSDVDVETHLPELATYLGHCNVNASYWYLSASPELLKLATLRWQRREKGGE